MYIYTPQSTIKQDTLPPKEPALLLGIYYIHNDTCIGSLSFAQGYFLGHFLALLEDVFQKESSQPNLMSAPRLWNAQVSKPHHRPLGAGDGSKPKGEASRCLFFLLSKK